jgi:VWFA-related protein
MSNSMAAEALRVRDAAGAFIDALQPGDRARIGSFNDEVALSPHLTGDKTLLRRVIAEELWPGGATPLWTAMAVGMATLTGESGRRVVLTLSDGGDACIWLRFGARNGADRHRATQLCATAGDVTGRALLGEFMIYAIGMEGPGLEWELTDLAAKTGGGYFKLRRNADLAATLARVVDELHHQYVIGFEPAVLDGKTHELDVRVTRPGLSARSRKSYLAVAR